MDDQQIADNEFEDEILELPRRQLSPADEQEKQMLVDWVRIDTEMRHRGMRPVWTGPTPMPKIGMRVGFAETYGTVFEYGLVRTDEGSYERVLWVMPASGSAPMKVTGSDIVPVSDDDVRRIETQRSQLRRRLVDAGHKAEDVTVQRRTKRVKGAHLLEDMLSIVRNKGLVLDDKSGFHMASGRDGRRMYIAKKGGRVDLSGYAVDHPGIISLDAEEAKRRHMGRVRGQVDFDRPDDVVIEGFRLAVEGLLP